MTANPLELPLKDVHLPAGISWWPLAPGWWIVLGIGCFLILLIVMLRKMFRQPRFKKQAEQALSRIEQKLKERKQPIECLADLSVLLRRLMLDQKPSSGSAGLTGQAWLKSLDRPLKTPDFSQGIGQILLSGPYQREAKKEEVFQLIQLCRKWVKYL